MESTSEEARTLEGGTEVGRKKGERGREEGRERRREMMADRRGREEHLPHTCSADQTHADTLHGISLGPPSERSGHLVQTSGS